MQAPPADGDDEYLDQWTDVVNDLARAQARLMSEVEHDSGVAASSFIVLTSLLRAEQHRLAMSSLSATLGMTSGGFTKLADRLERAGLLERQSSPSDRRIVYAVLTADGSAAAELAAAAFRRSVERHIRPALSEAQLLDLHEIAQRLVGS